MWRPVCSGLVQPWRELRMRCGTCTNAAVPVRTGHAGV